MRTFYKSVIKAEDFPECCASADTPLTFDINAGLSDGEKEILKYMKSIALPLESGHIMYISSQEPVKIGGRYKDYPAFISRIIYEPKKWWQFWKRKKQIGYEVTWK